MSFEKVKIERTKTKQNKKTDSNFFQNNCKLFPTEDRGRGAYLAYILTKNIILMPTPKYAQHVSEFD